MKEKSKELESLLSDESFQNWISGKATEDQIKKWTAWLNEAPHHSELYQEALKLWRLFRFRPTILPEVEQEWRKLYSRLNLKTKRPASIRDISSRSESIRQHRHWRQSWLRFGAIAAAAVLLITLFLHNLIFRNHNEKQEFQIVSTDYGQRAQITLPEGTAIILNANSTLRYPAVWTQTTARQFELQGEAYFDIAVLPEGPQHDFIVRTSDGLIQVVGTRFVVYDRGEGTRVVVEEGGVEVLAVDSRTLSPVPETKVLLKPGDLLQFRKGSRTLQPKPVNILPYTTWWLDFIVLKETPFEEIIQRLEETYGIQVQVKDERLLKRTLSGSIENQNLGVVTEALAKALRVPIHRKGKIIIFGNPSL